MLEYCENPIVYADAVYVFSHRFIVTIVLCRILSLKVISSGMMLTNCSILMIKCCRHAIYCLDENSECVLPSSIEEFIPLLRERMNVLNPYVRQFLVGWITVLDSVPDIDMLGFLPDFLDGKCSFTFGSCMFFI